MQLYLNKITLKNLSLIPIPNLGVSHPVPKDLVHKVESFTLGVGA